MQYAAKLPLKSGLASLSSAGSVANTSLDAAEGLKFFVVDSFTKKPRSAHVMKMWRPSSVSASK